MALDTYSALQEAALNVVGREGDSSLTAYAPVAIDLAHAKLNRNLRVGDMETSVTLAGTNGVFALPADFVAWRQVKGAYGPLDYATPDWLSDTYPTNAGGSPKFFTVKGSSLIVYPATTSVDIDYYAKIPALSDSNTSNWLLSSHPDIYLFMTVSELELFAKNDAAAVMWNQRGMTAVEELNAFDKSKRYSRVSARVKGPTP